MSWFVFRINRLHISRSIFVNGASRILSANHCCLLSAGCPLLVMLKMLRICRTRCVVQHLSIRNCSQSHRNALVDNAHVMSKMFSDNSARKRVRRRGINWNDWIAFCQPISAMFLTDPVKVMDKIGATGPLTTLLESVLRGDLQEEEKMQRFLFQAVLFPLFEKEQNEALNHARSSSVLDLRMPHEWYPAARAMQRRIVFHCGATNTGKVAPPSSEYSPMLRFFT